MRTLRTLNFYILLSTIYVPIFFGCGSGQEGKKEKSKTVSVNTDSIKSANEKIKKEIIEKIQGQWHFEKEMGTKDKGTVVCRMKIVISGEKYKAWGEITVRGKEKKEWSETDEPDCYGSVSVGFFRDEWGNDEYGNDVGSVPESIPIDAYNERYGTVCGFLNYNSGGNTYSYGFLSWNSKENCLFYEYIHNSRNSEKVSGCCEKK